MTPTDAVTLARIMPEAASTRADVGLWLSEVQANRCIVDRTCFLLRRDDTPVGYLLGLTRHGQATCTGLEVFTSGPHIGTWHLVHAFMERLMELAVDSADFCLSDRAQAAAHMLVELGARELGSRDDPRFGTGRRRVLQLSLSQSKFQKLQFMGQSGAPVNRPGAPNPTDLGFGPRGGNLFHTAPAPAR